jgi:aminoglycoside phosphotransferase (APT) family kinase protein
MAQALPTAARDIVDRVCLSYREWAPAQPRPPSLAGALAGSDVNLSLLLRGDGQCWVLRIPRGDQPDGVCYRRELRLHGLAAAQSLAPGIALAEPETGLLVTSFLAQDGARCGATAAQPDPATAAAAAGAGLAGGRATPAAIAGLLRAIHALDPAGAPACERVTRGARGAAQADIDLAPLDAAQELDRLRHGLAQRDPLRDLPPVAGHCLRQAAERSRTHSGIQVICHNDLLQANRLAHGGRLLAIDWEYARPGDAFFDLAVVASELDARQRVALLAAYLRRHPTGQEQQHLIDQLVLYTAIAACWYMRHGSAGAARTALARLVTLAEEAPHETTRLRT